MPLSTSSSDDNRDQTSLALRRAIVAILSGLIIIVALIEVSIRGYFWKMSVTHDRIRLEAAAAVQIKKRAAGPKNILLLGNSLLQAAVNIEELNRHLQPNWRVIRFSIDQTTYYDWYYGLRRLLAEGASPDVVMFCAEPRHIICSSVHNEIFAYYLMHRKDILDVSQKLDMTPSQTFELVLANTSAYWALRKEIRKNLLGRLLPGLRDLALLFAQRAIEPTRLEEILISSKARLKEIKEIAASRGSLLGVVLPPPLTKEHAYALSSLGEDICVPIIAPLTNDNLRYTDYERDGYHLSAEGREKFTRAMSAALLDALDEWELAFSSPITP